MKFTNPHDGLSFLAFQEWRTLCCYLSYLIIWCNWNFTFYKIARGTQYDYKRNPFLSYTTKATKWFWIASKVHGFEVNQNCLRSYFGSFWKILVYDQIMLQMWPVLDASSQCWRTSKSWSSEVILNHLVAFMVYWLNIE